MSAIFLSASIPVKGSGDYYQTTDPFLIQVAVRELIIATIRDWKIVWGGHPAITPMIFAICQDLGVDYAESIILYQSRYFTADFPPENDAFDNIVFVDAVDDDRQQSLQKMREAMLSRTDLEAAVFIGGMEDVEIEYDLFRRFHPQAKVIPVAATGGATRQLAIRLSGDPSIDSDLNFARMFQFNSLHSSSTLATVTDVHDFRQQSLDITDKIEDAREKVDILQLMAVISVKDDQTEEALNFCRQSLEIEDVIGDAQGKAATLQQMASIYGNKGQSEQAEQLYQQSLAIENAISNIQSKAESLKQMTFTNTETALELYEKSLQLQESVDNILGKAPTAPTLIMRGQLWAIQGNFAQAINAFEQSVAILQPISPYGAKAAEKILQQVKLIATSHQN